MKQDNPFDLFDFSDVLTHEARSLRSRAKGSARMICWVILAAAALILTQGNIADALLWLVLSGAMVGVTLIYAHVIWADGISDAQTGAYLRGHVIVSASTGAVWGGFAIYQSQGGSETQAFVAAIVLTSLTTGGAMAGTVYRPGYLAIATTSLIPFGLYLILFSQGPTTFFGAFILGYYGFCYVTNEQASARTRQAIISDLGRASALEVFEKNAIVERMIADKERFMAAISHDMSQPVVAQQHLLASLEKQLDTDAHASTIAGIRQAMTSQKHLLDELIAYSKLDTLAAAITIEPIDAEAFIETLCLEFAGRADARNLTVTRQIGCDTVFADRHILLRIMRNLLSNAVKYADSTITIHVTGDADTFLLDVTNDGPGIPPEDLSRVFDEYVRLPNANDQPGLGLGLTISRGLVSKLGGALDLISTQDHTRVRVTLPVCAASAQPAPGPSPFVLIIGKNEDPRLGSYSEILSLWMWQFAHVDTPDEASALVTLLGTAPDVAVIDPLHGPDLTPQTIRTLSDAINAPVLAIARDTDIALADHVLNAPFSPLDLRNRITALMQPS